MLQKATNKLKNPGLTAAYSAWKRSWDAEQQLIKEKAIKEAEKQQRQKEMQLMGGAAAAE